MNKTSHKHVQRVLERNPCCYILIACGHPSEDGHIDVEMTYQGDASLAAYLLQSAQIRLDQEEDEAFDLQPT